MEAKKAILLVMVAAVLALAFGTFAQAQEIMEKPDPASWRYAFCAEEGDASGD